MPVSAEPTCGKQLVPWDLGVRLGGLEARKHHPLPQVVLFRAGAEAVLS